MQTRATALMNRQALFRRSILRGAVGVATSAGEVERLGLEGSGMVRLRWLQHPIRGFGA